MKIKMLKKIEKIISELNEQFISAERKDVLQDLINFVQTKKNNNSQINLNFICTHNSRRSQFAQIWAKVASAYFGIETKTFSGGVEVTSFNKNVIKSLEASGFKIYSKNASNNNPVYEVRYSDEFEPLNMFSKIFDDESNPSVNFCAVMTCSDAEENCPFIPGAEKRISIKYDDPKEFDTTPWQEAQYEQTSRKIANEMFYIFSKVKVK
jgi:arsenate reductase (thioredoxin)